MASKYWLKLFHETIYDPKIMMRSPGARLRWYECLCLAGDLDRDGELPSIEHMLFVFRISEEQLLDELSELARAGMIVQTGDVYVVKNWVKRQQSMDTNERSKRYRDTKQKQEYYEPVTNMQRKNHESATICDADIDIDIDIDKDKDKEEIEDKAEDEDNILISRFASISKATYIPRSLTERNKWLEVLRKLSSSGVTDEIMARACEGRNVTHPAQILTECARMVAG